MYFCVFHCGRNGKLIGSLVFRNHRIVLQWDMIPRHEFFEAGIPQLFVFSSVVHVHTPGMNAMQMQE